MTVTVPWPSKRLSAVRTDGELEKIVHADWSNKHFYVISKLTLTILRSCSCIMPQISGIKEPRIHEHCNYNQQKTTTETSLNVKIRIYTIFLSSSNSKFWRKKFFWHFWGKIMMTYALSPKWSHQHRNVVEITVGRVLNGNKIVWFAVFLLFHLENCAFQNAFDVINILFRLKNYIDNMLPSIMWPSRDGWPWILEFRSER